MAVVEVVGLSANNRAGHSVRIEAAMKKALDAELANGETRPNILKKRMMAARAEEQRKMGLPADAVPDFPDVKAKG